MSTSPLSVSVVIPCYNGAEFLAQTLRSVLAQTRAVSEILVVDDGSTDQSAEIAASFGDPVRVVTQANAGVGAARNRGVAEARGDVIAFVDADDLWHPEKIEKQVAYLESHPDAGAVMTSVVRFTDDPGQTVPFLEANDDDFRRRSLLEFLCTCWLNQSAIAVRAPIARLVPYPVGATDAEDVVQSVQLRMATVIGAVPEVLAYYRMHPKQATRRAEHNIRASVLLTTWAAENHQRLGLASAAEATVPLLTKATRQAMHHYWKRDMARFKYERDEILKLWPPEVEPPAELSRFILPSVFYTWRDRLLG